MASQCLLTWTPAGGANSTSQEVQYKASSSSVWITAASLGPTVNTYTIKNLDDNTIYDYRIVNICAVGGPSYAPIKQAIRFVCPVLTLTPSYNQVAYSFPHVQGSITKYVISLLNSSDSIVATQEVTTMATTISGTFTGLTQSTTYKVRITMYADSYSNQCPPQSVTTGAAPTCAPPTNVVATMQVAVP